MKMKIFLFVLPLMMAMASCSQTPTNVTNMQSAQEMKSLIESGECTIVDVRSLGEFESGHVASAILVPHNDPSFIEKVSKLDRQKPIVFYCAVGGRSTRAVNQMSNLGFAKVYNFVGGMQEWQGKNMPVVKGKE
jgi:rhodanese-related sulfurtransferase